jgi:hypothetical protein
MTLPAPSKAFGALSWPLVGLNSPDPAPPVATRSTSSIAPFADRLYWTTAFWSSFVWM